MANLVGLIVKTLALLQLLLSGFFNVGGPDGFRTQCLILSDFLLIKYVYAMYLLGFK